MPELELGTDNVTFTTTNLFGGTTLIDPFGPPFPPFSGQVVLTVQAQSTEEELVWVDGIYGVGFGTESTGVVGQGSLFGVLGRVEGSGELALPLQVNNAGVCGVSLGATPTAGVFGLSDNGTGVYGLAGYDEGTSGTGVIGESGTGVGVLGAASGGFGVMGVGAFAGYFLGEVLVVGSLTVLGAAKSAAVPHPDGTLRRLYCVESPESWFEDFGEATLHGGKARVDLDPDFAALIKLDHYHVFLTPYGDSGGLFVSGRDAKGFDVHEHGGGTGRLAFSYRIVARRKDVTLDRLAPFSPPPVPAGLAGDRPARQPGQATRRYHRPMPAPKRGAAQPPTA